ncbi:hypothetical protein TNCT_290121 [Trichonephila clavata]|uniref:Uncharacterized protein n=1 Tax=Trichonephila clavata TaxID=2740835 RepID=A0A8X6IXG5_TRICU|nr:hypothetical protein TNCT_290121 [Trichonephila clavata]
MNCIHTKDKSSPQTHTTFVLKDRTRYRSKNAPEDIRNRNYVLRKNPEKHSCDSDFDSGEVRRQSKSIGTISIGCVLLWPNGDVGRDLLVRADR